MNTISPDKELLLTAPAQYVNREHILENCGKYILKWGKRALVSGGTRAMQAAEAKLFPALDAVGIAWERNAFAGECCDESIRTIKEKAQAMQAQVIIGVGGGKSLDSAKVAAEECGVPVICIPTIAATCAAASGLSVIYNSHGEYERDQYLLKNPNLVLVDPEIIANAPIEYLESGILDSLSKWYEGSAAYKGIASPNIFTQSAVRLARLLNETMENDAIAAVRAARSKQVNPALVAIVDMNLYLAAVIQCIGKNTRGAAAHSIHAGLSVIPASHEILHGFKVGYGIIVQLFMENAPQEEIARVVKFFRQLDLEPSFRGLKLPFEAALVKKVAEKSVVNEVMKNMPISVTVESLVKAMEKTEEMMSRF